MFEQKDDPHRCGQNEKVIPALTYLVNITKDLFKKKIYWKCSSSALFNSVATKPHVAVEHLKCGWAKEV